MGFVQWLAISFFFSDYLGWYAFIAGIVGFVVAGIPIVGAICGFIGATAVWHWEWWQAGLLFFWYPVFVGLLFIAGHGVEAGKSLFKKKDTVGQTLINNDEGSSFCLFGTRSRQIKKAFPVGIWVMRAYFFMICLSLAATIFFIFVYFNYIELIDALLFLTIFVYAAWALRGIYAMKVWGFVAVTLLSALNITLAAMQVIDSPTTLVEIFAFLLGLYATWIAWRVASYRKEIGAE
jgi:MFS family permease